MSPILVSSVPAELPEGSSKSNNSGVVEGGDDAPTSKFQSLRKCSVNLKFPFRLICVATLPLALLSLVPPLSSVLRAQTSGSPSAVSENPGALVGTVVTAQSGKPVEGAVVRIEGTDRVTTTDRFGRFEFTDAPPGRQVLTITAASIRPVRVTDVTVDAAQQLTLSPVAAAPASRGGDSEEMVVRAGSDVVKLSQMVVEGYRAGRSKAVQQKRESTNILDLISADAIGNLPDRNVAEAVARLPGVSAAPLDGPFDQPQGGEGRYVSIRGIDPNLNQVLVDGNTMSAPGGTRLGRAVPLDVLGSTQISQIEVVKTSTPDMDGNALGGTINVKTASAYDRKERFFQGSATVNYNETSAKKSPTADISYGDIFGVKRQWGFTMSATSDKRSYGQERLDFSRPVENTVAGQTFLLPNQIQIRPTWGYRLNAGVTMNLEYRPNDHTQVYLRTIFNRSRTDQNWDEFRLDSGGITNAITLTSPTSGIFAAARTQSQYREHRQLRSQALYNVATGLKKVWGHLTVEPVLSFSYAEEVRDKLRQFRFQTTRGALGRLEFELKPGERYPSKWEGLGAEWNDLAKYQFNLRRIDDGGVIEDETIGGKLDVKWAPEKLLGGTGFVKAGGKINRRNRFVDLVSAMIGPGSAAWTLATLPSATGPGQSIYDGRYRTPFSLNWTNVVNYVEQNPNASLINLTSSASNSVEDDYDIVEDIYAAYAMGQVKYGRLTFLGGIRGERTEAAIGAVENRIANGRDLGRFPIKGSTQYNSYFPNLQAVYRPNKQLVMRAALTQSIGRPAYEDARPLSSFRYDEILGSAALNPAFPYAGSLTIGNPKLKPFRSFNTDLSLEYYMSGGAMLSAALFRKNIHDPIYGYSHTEENIVYSGIGLERLNVSTRLNGRSGEVKGFEFGLYQPFRFLRAPFDGFGVEANLTFISSEVVVDTRAGEKLPFFRQPDAIRNLTLFYEKHGFSARVSYNYTAQMMTSLSAAAVTDNWADGLKRVDAQLRYRFSRHYAVTLAARNLTREQENYSFGKGGPLRETYLIGQNYTFGVSVNY
jgi:TonB-dependent receptor